MNHKITIPANGNRLAIIKAFIVFLWKLPADKSFDVAVTLHTKTRTPTQNNALHKYCGMLSTAFNDAGYTVEMILTKPLNISWTDYLVKELIWKRVQEGQLGKESTTKLETHEVGKIYEEINNFTGSEYGIYVPFPSREM
jgi:phospholipase C